MMIALSIACLVAPALGLPTLGVNEDETPAAQRLKEDDADEVSLS